MGATGAGAAAAASYMVLSGNESHSWAEFITFVLAMIIIGATIIGCITIWQRLNE